MAVSATTVMPLEPGSVVVTDVATTHGDDPAVIASGVAAIAPGPSDVIILAVPAGEGVTVETFLRRALRLEAPA